MELDQPWSRSVHLGEAPAEKELAESGPLAAADPAAVELELDRTDTAGVGLGRAGLERCRVDSGSVASALAGTAPGQDTASNPSAVVDRWQALDTGQRAELVDRDIVHTEARNSDSGAQELDTVLAELDTAG